MNFIEILSILLIFGKIFGFFVVLIIIRNSKSLNKDIPWVVLILLFPFVGSLIYLILGSDIIKSSLLQEIPTSIQKNKKYFIHGVSIDI